MSSMCCLLDLEMKSALWILIFWNGHTIFYNMSGDYFILVSSHWIVHSNKYRCFRKNVIFIHSFTYTICNTHRKEIDLSYTFSIIGRGKKIIFPWKCYLRYRFSKWIHNKISSFPWCHHTLHIWSDYHTHQFCIWSLQWGQLYRTFS